MNKSKDHLPVIVVAVAALGLILSCAHYYAARYCEAVIRIQQNLVATTTLELENRKTSLGSSDLLLNALVEDFRLISSALGTLESALLAERILLVLDFVGWGILLALATWRLVRRMPLSGRSRGLGL